VDELAVVATTGDTEAVARLVPDAPVTTRFLLVWITGLPADDGRFRSGISELQVVRA
jgi:putative peptidoglycan lipid II flippase